MMQPVKIVKDPSTLDRLVDFELAKMLKELGLIQFSSNCFGDNIAYQVATGEMVYAHEASVMNGGYVLAPTLSLAQKRLRELNMYVEVTMDINQPFLEEYFEFTIKNKQAVCVLPDDTVTAGWEDYDECLLVALKQAARILLNPEEK